MGVRAERNQVLEDGHPIQNSGQMQHGYMIANMLKKLRNNTHQNTNERINFFFT
jgi:hypothetical protein